MNEQHEQLKNQGINWSAVADQPNLKNASGEFAVQIFCRSCFGRLLIALLYNYTVCYSQSMHYSQTSAILRRVKTSSPILRKWEELGIQQICQICGISRSPHPTRDRDQLPGREHMLPNCQRVVSKRSSEQFKKILLNTQYSSIKMTLFCFVL